MAFTEGYFYTFTPTNTLLHYFATIFRYVRNPDKQATEILVYDSPAPTYPLSSFTNVPVSKGSLVIIHGQVVHRSELNRSKKSRHAYTFHVIESDGVKYSEDNWLQPPAGKEFSILYTKS